MEVTVHNSVVQKVIEQVQLCGPPSIFEVNTDLTNAEHKPVSV